MLIYSLKTSECNHRDNQCILIEYKPQAAEIKLSVSSGELGWGQCGVATEGEEEIKEVHETNRMGGHR